MHDLAVISTLAGGLAAALVFGWITQRLGLSTLVGYMLAGILVGPYTPGFVADPKLAAQMAEIGVILLMFGVGMHFHPQELLRVWRIAVPGAIAQSVVATIAGWACARWFGWSNAAGFVFGMALAVASTVVLMRMLVDQNRLATRAGHVAVGWLIVEDLFTVVALVVLPVALVVAAVVPVAASDVEAEVLPPVPVSQNEVPAQSAQSQSSTSSQTSSSLQVLSPPPLLLEEQAGAETAREAPRATRAMAMRTKEVVRRVSSFVCIGRASPGPAAASSAVSRSRRAHFATR